MVKWLRAQVRDTLIVALVSGFAIAMVVLALKTSITIDTIPMVETPCVLINASVQVNSLDFGTPVNRCEYSVTSLQDPRATLEEVFLAYKDTSFSFYETPIEREACMDGRVAGGETKCYVSSLNVNQIVMEPGELLVAKDSLIVCLFIFGAICAVLAAVGLIILYSKKYLNFCDENEHYDIENTPTTPPVAQSDKKPQFTKEEVSTSVCLTSKLRIRNALAIHLRIPDSPSLSFITLLLGPSNSSQMYDSSQDRQQRFFLFDLSGRRRKHCSTGL